jgi:hypothetical protein
MDRPIAGPVHVEGFDSTPFGEEVGVADVDASVQTQQPLTAAAGSSSKEAGPY